MFSGGIKKAHCPEMSSCGNIEWIVLHARGFINEIPIVNNNEK